MKERFKLTALEKSWILYDVGNSAFVLLVSTLIPIYFNELAIAAQIHQDMYLSYWAYAGSVATLLVALIGPICGALTDRNHLRKPFFLGCILLGIGGCACLGLVEGWLVFLVIFVLAKVGFSSSLVFYDSMLPEITDCQRMDKVSTMGYAYGYIGSVIPFVACLVVVLFAESFGLTAGSAMEIAFCITAAWWALCSAPLLFRYRQSAAAQEASRSGLGDVFRQLGQTLRHAAKHKHIGLYLVAFFFFINGVYTIIDMATAYGTALGLDTTGLLLALLVTQVVAFPCSILFGRLSARLDSGLLIKICICCYTVITLFAMFLVTEWQFWLLAVLVGMFQGGIQALSRSYLGKMVPSEKSGAYFGLMDICGKGASFLGALLVGWVSELTIGLEINLFGITLQNENLAVGALVVLFITGFILFCKADAFQKQ